MRPLAESQKRVYVPPNQPDNNQPRCCDLCQNQPLHRATLRAFGPCQKWPSP
jgi:hypothetical protein